MEIKHEASPSSFVILISSFLRAAYFP